MTKFTIKNRLTNEIMFEEEADEGMKCDCGEVEYHFSGDNGTFTDHLEEIKRD